MLKFDKIETRTTVVSHLYQQIKSSILRGELPTGYRIVEVNLANAFGVSRTPIREAVSRLIAQGFIREEGNAKFVADISVSMAEIMGLRGVLESYAARLAAQNRTDADLEAIIAHCDSRPVVERSSSISERASLNDSFHDAISKASHNQRLITMIADFYEYVLTEEMLTYYSQDDIAIHANHHHAIMEAIRDRKPDEAEAAMRRHIESVARVVERAIASMKSK